jgi:hypothetical protein
MSISVNKVFCFSVLGLILCLVSCKSEYSKAVEEGLASGIKNDSLIFGMRIGQTQEDFYKICWNLNKQKLISEGPGNMTAKYIEPVLLGQDSLKRRSMLFYGIFDNNKIMQGMDMTYSYYAWSTWNKKMHVTNLVEDLKSDFEKNYPSNPFIEIDLGMNEYKAYAKVDGDRQITIYPKNEKDVVVKIENLNYKLNHK